MITLRLNPALETVKSPYADGEELLVMREEDIMGVLENA